jgi:fructose-specific phosphotransferase system IIC component
MGKLMALWFKCDWWAPTNGAVVAVLPKVSRPGAALMAVFALVASP